MIDLAERARRHQHRQAVIGPHVGQSDAGDSSIGCGAERCIGGAIVLPTADVFALTPICPHALSNRSIILPLSATIRVKAINTQPAAFLNADGQIVGELDGHDEITIRRSRNSVRLMRLAHGSFLEAMRRKLHWRGTYL